MTTTSGLALAKGKKKAAPKAEPAEAKVAAVQSDEPKVSRADLSEFLVKPAEKALKARDYKLAVSLWRGIATIRGDADESMWRLAEAWQLAGQFDAAAEELERYEAAVTEQAKKSKAQTEIARLRAQERGFSGTDFQPKQAAEAAVAFKKGLAFYKKKQFAEAVLLYKAGFAMAPDLPGNIRELGQAYDALGRTAEANEFFVRYLRIRPFSKNADEVRKRLQQVGIVGELSIESSFPCEIVIVNRQPYPKKLPAQKLVVAPGRYKVLCYSQKYHFARYERVDVVQGQAAKISFNWAVIKGKLDPWARMTLEDPDDPKVMRDIGIDAPEFEQIGIPVPADRRALKYKLVAGGDPKKFKDGTIKLEAGKTVEITW